MIIELRKKSQITIPKEIVEELNLFEGDNLDITLRDGLIIIEPVAVYSKKYVENLENVVRRINDEPEKYSIGPFDNLNDVISYLESDEEEVVVNNRDVIKDEV